MLCAAVVVVFLVALRRVRQTLAQLGACVVGRGWPAAPYHLATLALTPPAQLPAFLSPASRSGHWRCHLHGNNFRSTGPSGARGSNEGKAVHASQPLSGTHSGQGAASFNRDLGCRAWRILEQLGVAGACLSVAPFPTSLPSCGTSSSPQPCAEIPVPPQKHTLSVHRGFWKHERIRDALSTMPGSQRVLSKSVLSVV